MKLSFYKITVQRVHSSTLTNGPIWIPSYTGMSTFINSTKACLLSGHINSQQAVKGEMLPEEKEKGDDVIVEVAK